MKAKKRFSYPIIVLYLAIGIMAFIFAAMSEWNDDAIAYSFFIPLTGEDASFTPITSITDIWHSQLNHYFNANGRFVVHFIVQIFCGLLGRTWFAVINTLVWMLLLHTLFAFAKPSFDTEQPASRGAFPACSLRTALVIVALAVIIFIPLPFTPPFQINYVWTACAVLLWLRWFFNRHASRPAALMLLAVASFLIGSLHEGFSIPVGGAILLLFCRNRGHLSKKEWVLACAFGIGALGSILAPGNFWRIGQESTGGGNLLNLLEQTPALLWFPLILLVFIAINKDFKNLRQLAAGSETVFLLFAIGVSLLLNLALGRIGRAAIPYNLFFTLLIIRYISRHKIPVAAIAALWIVAAAITAMTASRLETQNRKTRTILSEYAKSESGVIFIDNELFLFNRSETIERRNTYTNKLRHEQSPDKPFLVIYPKSMRHIDFQKDTNMIVKIGPQSWVCVQSATHPCDFVVEKVLMPGLADIRMAPRTLEIAHGSDVFIDSTESYKTALYVNDRQYVKANIIMADRSADNAIDKVAPRDTRNR